MLKHLGQGLCRAADKYQHLVQAKLLKIGFALLTILYRENAGMKQLFCYMPIVQKLNMKYNSQLNRLNDFKS